MTQEQKRWWLRLLELAQGTEHDQEKLQAIMRKLAMEMLADKSIANEIKINDAIFQKFGQRNSQFSTKQAYINRHKKNYIWGEDPILAWVLYQLGLDVQINLVGIPDAKPYSLFIQKDPIGVAVTINNYGAASGGTHWELAGQTNPGKGNCMYYTLAHAAQQAMPQVKALFGKGLGKGESAMQVSSQILKEEEKTTEKEKAKANEWASYSVKFGFFKSLSESKLKAVTTAFAYRDKEAEARYQEAANVLSALATETLVNIYHYAVKHFVGDDTYLKNRPSYVTKEMGSSFVEDALAPGKSLRDLPEFKEFEYLLRAELVHMLAKEAWRNPKAYGGLTDEVLLQEMNAKAAQQDDELCQTLPLTLRCC